MTSQPLRKRLRAFFEEYEGTLVFHNAPFDTKMLIKHLWMDSLDDISGMLYGLEILYKDLEDTRILTYLATNSTAGNHLSLKDQAFEFTGNYALDDIDDAGNIDRDELLTYNLIDACATAYTYDKHRQAVKETQESVYQDVFLPALVDITQMELVGMPMNLQQVEHTATELETIRTTHVEAIADSSLIQLFEEFYRAETAILKTAKLKKKVKTADDFADYRLNLNSSKQLQTLLYEFLELPVMHETDTGQPSTDAKALAGLIEYVKKQLEKHRATEAISAGDTADTGESSGVH
jgi:DNA polymerase-1